MEHMLTTLFFLLGLIAGGLLCRRGPKGEKGDDGMPGPQGFRGMDGKDSVDYDDYMNTWGRAVTGPRPHERSLREILEGINNKVDQLRIVAQVSLDNEARETRRNWLARLPNDTKDNPS